MADTAPRNPPREAPHDAPSGVERRTAPRSRFDVLRDLLFGALRTIARHAAGFYSALGLFLVLGLILAVVLSLAFSELAQHVLAGETLTFDQAVLRWMGAHRVGWVEQSLLEITALGTGLVVMVLVAVAATFLWLTEHRYSAYLLLVATAGGIVLDNVLKHFFDRPRPQIFEWGTHAMSSSFPSGHATSAAIVYGTVAYLAARLQARWWSRAATALLAAILIALICVSRLYLGVHYPSDVAAGLLLGFAWTSFCMSGFEAVRVFAARFRPRVLEHEHDLDHGERRAAGLE